MKLKYLLYSLAAATFVLSWNIFLIQRDTQLYKSVRQQQEYRQK